MDGNVAPHATYFPRVMAWKYSPERVSHRQGDMEHYLLYPNLESLVICYGVMDMFPMKEPHEAQAHQVETYEDL